MQQGINQIRAEHVSGMRITDGTKGTYGGKLNVVRMFLLTHRHETCVDNNGNIMVPLALNVLEDLFGWLSTNTDLPKRRGRQIHLIPIAEPHDDEMETNDHGVAVDDIFASGKATMSSSCMQGYKSAMLWLYRENKVIMEPAVQQRLSDIVEGYVKIVADKKSKGIMKISEGKSPLSFAGYNEVCRAMMTLSPVRNRHTFAESIFSWAFMVFMWNLMARSDSVNSIMLQHIDWRDDSMVITFAKHKGDQTGEGLSNDKHVYANPINPLICPVLTLAVLILTKNRLGLSTTSQLFEGNSSEGRFNKILASVIKDIPEEVNLGANRKDIGSHSNRKGSSTFVLGLSAAVSAVQVYLRAGWSLGNVQDRYIFSGAAGDQVVGRAVCGLPINDSNFAVLPPHFSNDDLTFIANQIGWNNIVEGNFDEFCARMTRMQMRKHTHPQCVE